MSASVAPSAQPTLSLAALTAALAAAGVTLSPAELAGLPGWYMADELAHLLAAGATDDVLVWVAFYRAERSHPVYG